jgi:hypothetical protein
MIFALLTLLAALLLAAVAGWFSIIGLMAILAGQPIAALVLGITLEAGKLVTTSWLYRNWKEAGWGLRGPLVYFTLALMLSTSLGVFGFLSKAHLEQGASTMDNSSKIVRMEEQILREKSIIADNDGVILQLDATVNSFLGKDRADRALSVRKSQLSQRKQLKNDSDEAQKRIEAINDEKFKLESDLRKLQLEVGPIRYIAELFYGSEKSDNKSLESAVRIFTLIIVSTLDPLAITLLIAANFTILRIQNEKKKKQDDTKRDASPKIPLEPEEDEQTKDRGVEGITDTPWVSPACRHLPQSITSVTADEKAALYAPPSLVDLERVDETKKDKESVWETWSLQESTQEDAAVDDGGTQIRLGQIQDTEQSEKIEILSEKEASVLSSEPEAPIAGFVLARMEVGEDTDEENVQSIDETEEVGISEEEKAIMASWLLRGKSYAGVRQPAPTQVIQDPDTAMEATADVPQISRSDSATTAIPLEIPSGGPVVIPWAHQANVYRELVGDAHFTPQRVNEEKVQERMVSQAPEADSAAPRSRAAPTEGPLDGEVPEEEMDQMALSPFEITTDELAQKAKYPKTLSWLTEFRRD